MKLKEVLTLKDLYEEIKDTEMPIKTVYKFALLMQKTQDNIIFYQKELSKIIDKYAKKEQGKYCYLDDQSAIAIKDGQELECQQKIEELGDIEVDLGKTTFKLDEFANLKLTLKQMTILMPFIEP